MGILRKKNQTETMGNKSTISQTKKHSGRLHQKTRTSGNRISELKDKIDVKEKNKKTPSQTTHEL
jgi:hypothetical protein